MILMQLSDLVFVLPALSMLKFHTQRGVRRVSPPFPLTKKSVCAPVCLSVGP